MAGLSAADALVRGGATVRVHEARDRVGGRLHSIATPGGVADLGATWFWSNEPLTRSLVEEFGLSTFSQHLRGDALFEGESEGLRRLSGNPIDSPSTRFAGGAQGLARGVADRLPSGTLHLADPVIAVTATDHRVLVAAKGGAVAADGVILALPPALTVDSILIDPPLPGEVLELASRTPVWMAEMVKAVAVYDDAFWRSGGLAGSAFSYRGPFQEFHDHSSPTASPAALFAFAPAARFAGQEPAAIDAAFRDQLERIFGAAAGEPRTTHIADWSRERYTAPSRRHPLTSTSAFGAPAFRSPVHNRIRWASTETASAFAGHIEGAITAGREVAGQILAARRS